ncbi:MAG: hypothetical protein AAFW87_13260 [Pseudomonadota bacterium]
MKNTFPYAVILTATTITFAFADVPSSEALARVTSAIGNAINSAKSGITLHAFREDTPSPLDCDVDCAHDWPPFEAGTHAQFDETKGFTDRKDG